jgi:hypothetical protein
VAVLLAVAMLAAWSAGWCRGRPRSGEKCEEEPSKFNDAVLALLGLLLAFTFSMSLARHEQRRQLVVIDSNAIGDFATVVSLLNDPVRGKLQGLVRRYVEHRLSMPQIGGNEALLQQKLAETRQTHAEMTVLVKKAIDEGTPVVVPLANTLNELTSAHASRLNALRDRLPPSVVLLLVLAAIIAMVLLGWQQGMSREWHPAAAIGFTALVCLVLWVTLDLNQPQRGLIKVSQEPLEQLLKGMNN